MPFVALGVGYRLYWRHGIYFTNELICVYIIQLFLTVMVWWSHYKTMMSDPGFLKSHHFRDPNKLYEKD